MTYGPSESEIFKGCARQIDKILKGANPANVPIEQPTKFDLMINAGTAKWLGIKIPSAILLRADEVIP